ncbi:MAG: 4-hydroxy-tetrahydrodipicolinate reductase [Desulfovibrio sp.]|jgi:4-hydroxy-tetrahydrodipicolinate reductase|nr:4-hydroxy-tetrahydrodipicolinate reductase [Desulfovibrio sp.]
MTTAIIVAGAKGHMGGTIRALVQSEPERYQLAGLVDRKECLEDLSGAGCPVSADITTVLGDAPGAVIVDFTSPSVSLCHARAAAESGHALVIGTTGFTVEQKEELEQMAHKAPIFWSSNMSVGVNVLLKILPELAGLLGESYDIEIVELHHGRKKDAPSGTALTLGECLAQARGWKLEDARCSSRDGIIGERPKAQIGVQAVRGGDVAGVHTVYFMGQGERIEICHHAHSRENFARGALRAADWLNGRKAGKLYGMSDIF